MKTLILVAIVVALLLIYALKGRAWLKAQPWAHGFISVVEPIELFLFKKSETILFARLKMLSGAILFVLTQIGEIDLSPWMPFVPDKWQPYVNIAVNSLPLLISLTGAADEKLRNATTLPIEVVAVPDKVIAENPMVAAVVTTAVQAKESAIAMVNEAKTERLICG